MLQKKTETKNTQFIPNISHISYFLSPLYLAQQTNLVSGDQNQQTERYFIRLLTPLRPETEIIFLFRVEEQD